MDYEEQFPQAAHNLSHEDGCMNYLEVSDGGRLVKYIGRGRDDMEAASIRSNAPLAPSPLPIGYFEALVVDSGRDGYMSVGLMTKRSLLDKLVGWSAGAIGYHGDDGNLFTGSGMGKQFGPLYSTNDSIGCGINWISETVFFTKNGKLINSVPSPFSPEEVVYAATGMRTPGETFKLNFGETPFIFDLDAYNDQTRREVVRKRIKIGESDKISVLKLIQNHCLFNGYTDTAQILEEYCANDQGKCAELCQRRSSQLDILESIKSGTPITNNLFKVYPDAQGNPHIEIRKAVLEFMEFVFQHPQSLDEIVERGELLFHRADAEIQQLILRVLPYNNPGQSDSAISCRHQLREELCALLDESCGFQNSLKESLDSAINTCKQNSLNGNRTLRIWHLMDHNNHFINI